MEFWLQKDDDNKIQLPVKPSEYTVSVSNKNTVVNVTNLGDLNLIGKTGLREITLSSFFPKQAYNFSHKTEDKAPFTYVKEIESWRTSGKPIRVIITGTLNMLCTIESFSYGERDGTRDIYYTLALKEYRKPSTEKVKSSATEKASTRTVQDKKTNSGKTYTVKEGDTLWSISKRKYGDNNHIQAIVDNNSSTIKNPNKIQVGQVILLA